MSKVLSTVDVVNVGDVVEFRTWLGRRIRGIFLATCISQLNGGRGVTYVVLDNGLVKTTGWGWRPRRIIIERGRGGLLPKGQQEWGLTLAHAHQECLRRSVIHAFEDCGVSK